VLVRHRVRNDEDRARERGGGVGGGVKYGKLPNQTLGEEEDELEREEGERWLVC